MAPVVTAAEMRELDRLTIEELGVPGAVLMENAGRAVADAVERLAPAGARVAVVCGPGNNGGDGFVCARWLREHGRDARVLLVAGRPRQGGDAALHLGAYEKTGGPVLEVGGDRGLSVFDTELAEAAVVVDAIYGTGLSRAIEGQMAEVIRRINRAPGQRVAVDIPSGLDADHGRVLGVAVEPQLTVTFAFAKVGLVCYPGFERAGRVEVVEIGIPRALAARAGVRLELLEGGSERTLMPRRPRGGHKGTFGHLLVIAGSPGKAGAALLCASGGLRAGAGLCTLAVPPELRPSLEGRALEVMLATLDAEAPREGELVRLVELAAGKRAIAWGPGMPTTPGAGELLRRALRVLEVPLVLDADALNHLAQDPTVLTQVRAPVVLTPHPGEAARLLETDTQAVQADRVGAARRLAAQTGATVALKGARTVIAAPDGWAGINPTGNPGMGTAGSGDVLTGVIGALLAQGLGPVAAATLGVFAHGRAGDLARAAGGETGMIAGDLLAHLPAAFASLERE